WLGGTGSRFGTKKWMASAMQAPTGIASNFCAGVFTTGGVTNAVSAPGLWTFESIPVRGWSSSTMLLISRRRSYLCQGTGRRGRPDSALPGRADQTFSVGSMNPGYLSGATRRTAGYLRLDRLDHRELSPLSPS